MLTFTLHRGRTALYMVLAFLLMSAALLLAIAPAAAQNVPRNQDVPLQFLPPLPPGNYGVAQEGVGLFPDLTAGNITVPVPATCADGSLPGIALATLTWVHRNSEVVDLDPDVRFGPAGQPLTTIVSERTYGPWDVVRNNARLIFTTYNTTVTNLVQPGVNTYRIEGFDAPVQFGAGLQIIYECPELPLATISRAEGNDFYYVLAANIDPRLGPTSETVCTEFEPSDQERVAEIGVQVPGSANKQRRFTVMWYATGNGGPQPTNIVDVTGEEAPGIYNGPGNIQRVNLSVITQPTPAEEWDGRIINATIRPGDTWLCIQGESPTDAEYPPFSNDGGGSAEGASGVLAGAIFSIPVAQQPPEPTPVPPEPTPVPPQPTNTPPVVSTPGPPVVSTPGPPVVSTPGPPIGPTAVPPGPTTVPPGPTAVPPLPPPVVVEGQPIIVKTVSTPFALPGDVVTWTISVTNPTDLPLPDVACVDTMPSQLSISAVNTATGSIASSGQNVSWTIGTLAPGETVTATITTRVNLDVALPFVIENLAALEPPYIGTSRARVISITTLPQTGETPWWRDLVLFLVVAGGSFTLVEAGMRVIPARRPR